MQRVLSVSFLLFPVKLRITNFYFCSYPRVCWTLSLNALPTYSNVTSTQVPVDCLSTCCPALPTSGILLLMSPMTLLFMCPMFLLLVMVLSNDKCVGDDVPKDIAVNVSDGQRVVQSSCGRVEHTVSTPAYNSIFTADTKISWPCVVTTLSKNRPSLPRRAE